MFEKSKDLRRTVIEIDHLLQTMHIADVDLDQGDVKFLQRSRRSIILLLEARQKLNLHKIVSLKGWREGSVIVPQVPAEEYPTMAQAILPRHKALRPYLVPGTGKQLSYRTTSRS